MKQVSVLITMKNPEGTSKVYLRRTPERDAHGVVLRDHGRWRPTLERYFEGPLMEGETQDMDGLRRIGRFMVNQVLPKPEPVAYDVKCLFSSDDEHVLAVEIPFADVQSHLLWCWDEGYCLFSLVELQQRRIVAVSAVNEPFLWSEHDGMYANELSAVYAALALESVYPVHARETPSAAAVEVDQGPRSVERDSLSFPEDVPPQPMPLLPDSKLGKGGGLPAHMRREPLRIK